MIDRVITSSGTTEPIYLEITGAYGDDGYQDDEGVEHFNDRVTTPFGWLGHLKSHTDEDTYGQPCAVIDQADGIVLISRTANWDAMPGVLLTTNPFGFRIFELKGRNGIVRYLLCDDDVRWKDKPEEETGQQVGKLLLSQWRAEGPPPPRLTHVTKTEQIRQP